MEIADKHRELLQRGAELIRAALPSGAATRELTNRPRQPRTELPLDVIWVAGNEPRAAQTLRLFASEQPPGLGGQPHRVWVAPDELPSRVREALRESGVSFVHPSSGTVHIVTPGIVIDRTLRPSRAKRQRTHTEMSDPFGDNASRIVRMLMRTALGPSPRSWGVRELAAATGVDRTTTSEVLRWLARSDLVISERHVGRRGRAIAVQVGDPVRLLERWSASYDWAANTRLAVHAPIGSPERFVARLSNHFQGMRWATTLQVAAAMLAPHATWDRIHVYIDVPDESSLRAIAMREGWPAASDGKLVLMCPYYRKSVWDNVQTMRQIPIVDVVQLLLDLWRYPVRGREQAEHLFELRSRLPPTLFEGQS